jgi:hypothetical protein
MGTGNGKSMKWHYAIMPEQTRKAFDFLSKRNWLKKSGWYLAGGTALALQNGNRKSYDLDFFTVNRDFNERNMLTHFMDNPDWRTEFQEKNTIYGELYGAKISFIAYPFFIPAHGFLCHGSVKILNSADIALMKIIAISQRGKKRDFFDLYWCCHKIEPLKQLIKKLKKQYPSVAHNYNHILKSLVYFDDAENDPEPEICFEVTWIQVKAFFKKEVPRITAEIIGLK